MDEPFPDVAAALAHLGYVQIDPLNVCGRMHDLILRNRVAGYREGDLLRHLYVNENSEPKTRNPKPQTAAPRAAFEHYLPGVGVLAAFPRSAWPHLLPHMRQRRTHARGYAGKLSPAEERLAQHILAAIGARGPLMPDEIAHDGRATTAWGTNGRATKIVLEKLFMHGRVLIYDRRLTERLWGFDYTWEVYTPPAKRVRGYYALPVLAGHELVGDVDPRADRARRRLVVISRRLRRGHKAAAAVRELAQFLGLR